MKRVCTALMMMLLMSGVCYGAVSDDVYVRKDVFEVYMQSINTNMERILQRLDRIDEGLSEVKQAVAHLSGRVDGLEARVNDLRSEFASRIDDLRNGIYLLLTLAGLVIAVLSWPKVQEKLKALGKSTPSITLEDVNRLIEANNDKLLKNFQSYAK